MKLKPMYLNGEWDWVMREGNMRKGFWRGDNNNHVNRQ
jgi:hypothetical protein